MEIDSSLGKILERGRELLLEDYARNVRPIWKIIERLRQKEQEERGRVYSPPEYN